MAIHSSTLAWKIPWTEEPDRLHPMGSQRAGHNWATSLHFTSSLRMRGDFSLYLNLDFPDGCVPNDLYFRDDSEHHFIYHWLFVCLIWYYLYVFSNGHLYMPILKSSYLFWGFGVFLLLSYISSLYILNINPLSNVICKYFLPFSRLPSHVVDYFLCHVEAC